MFACGAAPPPRDVRSAENEAVRREVWIHEELSQADLMRSRWPPLRSERAPRLRLAELLIALDVDVDVRCNQGNCALWYAVGAGGCALELGRGGAPLMPRQRSGWFRLGRPNRPRREVWSRWHKASACDEERQQGDELVGMLLVANADADVPNCEGQTPLLMAAHCGRREAAALLLAYGADPNWSHENRRTPLMYAVAGEEVAGMPIDDQSRACTRTSSLWSLWSCCWMRGRTRW
mmetsp:Transcript_9143/g.22872  ORF Transcript_9143/g.22872 Transcript_9143/m.22872 type:complete len:235 (+) Transcript_9143:304-1008(+)